MTQISTPKTLYEFFSHTCRNASMLPLPMTFEVGKLPFMINTMDCGDDSNNPPGSKDIAQKYSMRVGNLH